MPANYTIQLTVWVVTPRAVTRVAPTHPAADRGRYAAAYKETRAKELTMLKRLVPGLAVLVNLVFGVYSSAQISLYPDPSPMLRVTGHGEVLVAPDMAVVSLGVYVLDPDLRKGKATSDSVVRRLLQVGQDLGIESGDTVSSTLSIDPKYSEAENPEFLGFEISRSVEFTLRELSSLDAVVDRAIQSGANREFSVSLRSSRESALRKEALALAIDDAKAQASRLATGFGVKLGPVRSISPGSSERGVSTYSAASISYGRGTFAPGTIRFQSDVSAAFQLEP